MPKKSTKYLNGTVPLHPCGKNHPNLSFSGYVVYNEAQYAVWNNRCIKSIYAVFSIQRRAVIGLPVFK